MYALLPIALYAQQDEAQKYASGITASDLKKHLSIIASADMEGRETAMPGQKKAAAYIESQFKQIGLKQPFQLSSYQQSYPLYKDTLLNSSLKVGKNKYELGKDYIVAPGTLLKQDIKAKEIIFIGYGIDDKNYDDYGAKNVKGKVVVFFSGEPKINGKALPRVPGRNTQWNTNRKTLLAKQKGAIAAIIINPVIDSISRITFENTRRTNLYFPRPVTRETERVTYADIVNKVAVNIFGEQLYNEIAAKVKAGDPLNTYNLSNASQQHHILWY